MDCDSASTEHMEGPGLSIVYLLKERKGEKLRKENRGGGGDQDYHRLTKYDQLSLRKNSDIKSQYLNAKMRNAESNRRQKTHKH